MSPAHNKVDEAAGNKNLPAQAKPSHPTSLNNGTAVAPASIQDMYKEDQGKGVSQAAEDNLVPLLYVLQPLSPQVDRRNAGAYIEGAEPGDIWLRNAPTPIIKGDQGIIVQPCYFYKDIGAWIPRDQGGGLVGRYIELPKDAVEVPSKHPGIKQYKLGNADLIDTRNHVVRVFLDQSTVLSYLIPLKSSGHSVSKQWMVHMNAKRAEDGTRIPSFGWSYKLITKQRKNADGTWFVLEPTPYQLITDPEQYKAGRQLHDDFAAGRKIAEQEIDTNDTQPSGNDPNRPL